MSFGKKKPVSRFANKDTRAKDKKTRAKTSSKIIQTLYKKYGDEIVHIFDGRHEYPKIAVAPTGMHGFNWALACGGWPRGRSSMIEGKESSGKTTLCLHSMAQAQRRGEKVALIDVENAVDYVYMATCGIKQDASFFLAQPNYGEQAFEILEALIESGEFGVIVVDSIPALIPLAELEAKMTDQQMGLQARMNSKSMRRLNTLLKGTPTAVIFINQLRDKIGGFSGGFGPQTSSPGGRAVKHAMSIIIAMQPAEHIKAGSKQIGFMTSVKITKNKVGVPSRRIKMPIVFTRGLDDRLDFIDLALRAKILRKKPGGKGIFLNQRLMGGSWAEVYKRIAKSPKLKAAIEKRILAFLAKTDSMADTDDKEE